MIAACLFFLAGNLLLYTLPAFPHRGILLGLFLLSLLLINKPHLKLVGWLVLGLAINGFAAQSRQALPLGWQAKPIVTQGMITSIPSHSGMVSSFIFKTTELNHHRFSGKIHLSWYGKHPPLIAGQRWRWVVRVKRPHGFHDPGVANYETIAFAKGIVATGYVYTKGNKKLLSNHWYDHPLDRMRERLYKRLQENIPNSPYLGILSALTIGIRDKITQQQWHILQATGTSHLVAISGLHISFMAGLFYGLGALLWRLGPEKFKLSITKPGFASLLSLLGAVFYSALAGFAIPTMRALIMLAFVLGARILRRNISLWQSLSLAIIIILLIDPLATLGASFWLSVGACSALIYGLSGRLYLGGWVKKSLRTQWVVAVGLIPLSIGYFQQISLISPLINIIAIPWVSFFVVPLALLGILIPFLLKIANFFLQYLFQWMSWCTLHMHPLLYVSLHHLWQLSLLSALLIISPRGMPGRYCSLLFLLPLCFPKMTTPATGEAWVTVLDVGQGLSTVVQTAHHLLIYDTGARFPNGTDLGQRVVLPFLRYEGLHKIDRVIISHNDTDHIGGLPSILQSLPVGHISSSQPMPFIHHAATRCYAGEHWTWDGVKFVILFPPLNIKEKMKNNHSCVLRITSFGRSILLPGDIEKPAEKILLHNKVQAEVLVAPHHGSKTSSSANFISAVAPKKVIFSVGYLNPYHLPSPSVVEAYMTKGAKIYSTQKEGAISFKFTSQGIISKKSKY